MLDWSWALPARCVCCTRRLAHGSAHSSANISTTRLSTTRLIPAACIRCQPRAHTSRLHLPGLDAAIAAFDYTADAAFLIRTAKYQPHAPLLTQLGAALAGTVLTTLKTRPAAELPAAVLAAPSHPKLLQRRGLNPARLLAIPLASALGVPLLEPFQRAGLRAPQAQLSRSQRRRTPSHLIACRLSLPNSVLIVDDVVTSGKTLQLLAQIARTAGAQHVTAAVVCNATAAHTECVDYPVD